MPKRRYDAAPKPVEEWTAKEWEAAYNVLKARQDTLIGELKGILRYLHLAIGKIQDTAY